MDHNPELLTLVDLYDREIGSVTKTLAHESPLLHRAFSVFLIDGDRTLLQRRAHGKYHSGGLWANSCCSHPRWGEQLVPAVRRRLGEELGVECSVREVGSFAYCHSFNEYLFEYEYDHVFIGRYAGDVNPDPDEIEQTQWISLDELEKSVLSEPCRYAVWFHTALQIVLKTLGA